MASREPGTTEPTTRPAGVAGDGDDRYPTYHDARSNPHPSTGAKATDTDLPRSRRTYALPFLIGLIIFAVAVIGYFVAGSLNVGRMTDEALSPGDPATPPPPAGAAVPGRPAGAEGTVTGTDQPETPGSLDRDVQPQMQSTPGEVEATPGGTDIPGGESTTPVEPAPAQ